MSIEKLTDENAPEGPAPVAEVTLIARGEAFAKYHDEHAGHGGHGQEFHHLAATFCRVVASDLAAANVKIEKLTQQALTEAGHALESENECFILRARLEEAHTIREELSRRLDAANARSDAELQRAEDWVVIAQDHMQQADAANARADAAVEAIRSAVKYSNGRACEWGERAEACFEILQAFLDIEQRGKQ